MVWEIVFFLVLLKIPVVYLCLVVWWAIRAQPLPAEPAVVVPIPDTPTPPGRPPSRRHRPGPARTASRGSAPRSAGVRLEARR